MKLKKSIQTIPIALAMQAFSPPAAALEVNEDGKATDSKIESVGSQSVTHTPDVITSIMERVFSDETDSFEQEYSFAPEAWEGKQESRFDELVTREAVGKITRAELTELDHLQKARRRLISPPSGEEVLLRYRREKLDRDLLQVLRRHVRIQPIA